MAAADPAPVAAAAAATGGPPPLVAATPTTPGVLWLAHLSCLVAPPQPGCLRACLMAALPATPACYLVVQAGRRVVRSSTCGEDWAPRWPDVLALPAEGGEHRFQVQLWRQRRRRDVLIGSADVEFAQLPGGQAASLTLPL
eukprot:EG_transcript_45815